MFLNYSFDFTAFRLFISLLSRREKKKFISFFSKIIYDWNNFGFIIQIEKSLGAHKNFFFGIFLYFFFTKFIISYQKLMGK